MFLASKKVRRNKVRNRSARHRAKLKHKNARRVGRLNT